MRDRITQEKATVELMIRLYCSRKEGNDTLCPACSELLDYAINRLDRCRFGPDKPTCRKCSVHCYSNEMRERIRTVMRWAENGDLSSGSGGQAPASRKSLA